jgi:hypothetical protein
LENVVGKCAVSRLLQQLVNGEFVSIQIMFCQREYINVGILHFSAQITELDRLFV